MSGRVRCEFHPNTPAASLPLADRYHIPHPAARLDDPGAELTVREHGGAPAVAVDRGAWRFARAGGDGTVVADASHVWLAGGFEPGKIYDCYYEAQDPPVVGLGFTAVRDTASFLRFGSAASGNPCAGLLDRSHVFGISQSGRFLRHLLYLGLDEDEEGRPVFDGAIPHVAGARRGEFNLRFGQPSLNAQHGVGDLFPFTDGEQEDPLTGRRGALLGRLLARGRVPKIFTINTAAEYWRGDASLVHTDVAGKGDIAAPANVRIYLHAGAQHTPGSIPPGAVDPNTGARGRHAFGVVDYSPLLRAALVNLDRWVGEGVEPPPSAVPRVERGTAVAAETLRAAFESIPGVRSPERIPRPVRLDFGPEVERGVDLRAPAEGGGALRDARLRGRRRRQRDGGRAVLGAAGAAGHAHGLEPAASRPGGPGRSHEHDGLHAAVFPHGGRARPLGRSAPLDRGALSRPPGLSRPRARGRRGDGRRAAPAGGGRRGGRRARRPPLGLRPVLASGGPTMVPPSPRRSSRPGTAGTLLDCLTRISFFWTSMPYVPWLATSGRRGVPHAIQPGSGSAVLAAVATGCTSAAQHQKASARRPSAR